MNLKEFRESKDRNLFWRLQSGERQNLLDEAIEIIDCYESNQVEAKVSKRYEVIIRKDGLCSIFDNERKCRILNSISPQAKYNEDVVKEVVFLLNRDAC